MLVGQCEQRPVVPHHIEVGLGVHINDVLAQELSAVLPTVPIDTHEWDPQLGTVGLSQLRLACTSGTIGQRPVTTVQCQRSHLSLPLGPSVH